MDVPIDTSTRAGALPPCTLRSLTGLLLYTRIVAHYDMGAISALYGDDDDRLKNDLDLSGTEQGAIVFVGYTGLCIGCVVGGLLLRALPAKPLLQCGLGFIGVGTLLAALSTHVASMLVARLIVGFGQSFITVLYPVWAYIYPFPKSSPTYLAILQAGGPLGTVAGYVVSGFMMQKLGWQWCFYLQAILLLPAIVWYVFVPNNCIDIRASFPPAAGGEGGEDGRATGSRRGSRTTEPFGVADDDEDAAADAAADAFSRHPENEGGGGGANAGKARSPVHKPFEHVVPDVTPDTAATTPATQQHPPAPRPPPGTQRSTFSNDMAEGTEGGVTPGVPTPTTLAVRNRDPTSKQLFGDGDGARVPGDAVRTACAATEPMAGEKEEEKEEAADGEIIEVVDIDMDVEGEPVEKKIAVDVDGSAPDGGGPGGAAGDAKKGEEDPPAATGCIPALNAVLATLRDRDGFGAIKAVATSGLIWLALIVLSSLYFVVNGLQIWVTDYVTSPNSTVYADETRVIAMFGLTAATAPVSGIVVGGLILTKLGGYKRYPSRTTRAGLLQGILATIPAYVALAMDDFWAFMGCIWALLFFGAMMVPGIVGFILSAVPDHNRSLASSFLSIVYHILGYALGPLVAGIVIDFFDDPDVGVIWGFRVVLGWSAVAVLFQLKVVLVFLAKAIPEPIEERADGTGVLALLSADTTEGDGGDDAAATDVPHTLEDVTSGTAADSGIRVDAAAPPAGAEAAV